MGHYCQYLLDLFKNRLELILLISKHGFLQILPDAEKYKTDQMVKIAQMKNELGNSNFGVRSLWFPPKTNECYGTSTKLSFEWAYNTTLHLHKKV